MDLISGYLGTIVHFNQCWSGACHYEHYHEVIQPSYGFLWIGIQVRSCYGDPVPVGKDPRECPWDKWHAIPRFDLLTKSLATG